MVSRFTHVPVLKKEIVETLALAPGEALLDVTAGLGGHTRALLEAAAGDARAIVLDADAENLQVAKETLRPWSERVTFIHANFRELETLELPKIDVLLADLGLSSPHIDDASRGFSFRSEAPLDLRFDRTRGHTAAERLRTQRMEEIARALKEYGELPRSVALARALAERARGNATPLTTTDVRRVTEELYGYRAQSLLPQVFQALRIWTNDELAALETLLRAGPKLLRSGGRMGVISYHSLEDRLTKRVFRSLTTAPRDERTGQDLAPAPFELLTKKPITPGESELAENPRSRSAKFRAIRRRA